MLHLNLAVTEVCFEAKSAGFPNYVPPKSCSIFLFTIGIFSCHLTARKVSTNIYLLSSTQIYMKYSKAWEKCDSSINLLKRRYW